MKSIAAKLKNDKGENSVFNREDKPKHWTWNIETPNGYSVFNMINDMQSLGFTYIANLDFKYHTSSITGGTHYAKQIEGNWYHLIFINSRNPIHPFRVYFENWHFDRFDPFSAKHLGDFLTGGSQNGKRTRCQ
jgi:hypothetical protein